MSFLLILCKLYGISFTARGTVKHKNLPRDSGPRWGGACNAAAYLRSFVPADGPEYAHLDIAGVMDTCPGADDPSYISKGMTGRPTRTLAGFMTNYLSK